MPLSALPKNKIILSDYQYRRDIENRLLMAELELFEVDVLRELVHSPLTTTLDDLADQLSSDETTTINALNKLSPSKLFIINHDKITVNKEVRKYYESQIQKFDDDFEPNMEYLQELLSKVPIHVLPSWYHIPRHSDNIFESIIEKYLLTPKIYSSYLEELNFDDPILNSIVKDLYQSSDFKIPSSTFIKKYNLSREQFEEFLLILEYNFVCCLSYNKDGGKWQEVVTPFHEWREFCLLQERNKPMSIQNVNSIQRKEFSASASNPDILSSSVLYTPKNIREVERALKRFTKSEWIYLDDFLNAFIGSINNKAPVTLKSRGKRWKYCIPTYTQEEQDFVRAVILEQFWETGVVSIGSHNKRICFSVTPFGKMSIVR